MSEIRAFRKFLACRRVAGALVLAALVAGCSDSGDEFALIRAEPPRPVQGEPPFLLVHGAWFTSASWAAVQGALQEGGGKVVTVDLPGRVADGVAPGEVDLGLAVDKICQVIAVQGEPVVLVGHGLSGAVITQAAARCGAGIQALVYVAAVIPRSGESALAAMESQRSQALLQCLRIDETAGLARLRRDGPLEQTFFYDLAAGPGAFGVEQALAGLVDEPLGIARGVLSYDEAVLAGTPKFYVHTTQDRVLSLAEQRAMVARMPGIAVYELASGHTPFLSQPRELAELLLAVRRILIGAD